MKETKNIGGRPGCSDSRLWAYVENDVVSGNDHEKSVEDLELWIKRSEFADVVYVRGDYFGDRTQYVELIDPRKLSAELVLFLQRWLKKNGNYVARIALPCCLGAGDREGVMVYHDTIVVRETEVKSDKQLNGVLQNSGKQ